MQGHPQGGQRPKAPVNADKYRQLQQQLTAAANDVADKAAQFKKLLLTTLQDPRIKSVLSGADSGNLNADDVSALKTAVAQAREQAAQLLDGQKGSLSTIRKATDQVKREVMLNNGDDPSILDRQAQQKRDQLVTGKVAVPNYGESRDKGELTKGEKDWQGKHPLQHKYPTMPLVNVRGKYTGEMRNGKAYGKGRVTFERPNAPGMENVEDYYEGEWYDDMPHGRGVWRTNMGKDLNNTVEGEFREGLLHGPIKKTEVMRGATTTWEGEFREGKRYGLHRRVDPDQPPAYTTEVPF